MAHRRIKGILGILILMLTINFIYQSRVFLFDKRTIDGYTRIEFNVLTPEIDVEAVRETVQQITQYDLDEIRVKKTGNTLEVEFEYMEQDVNKLVIEPLIEPFEKSLEVVQFEKVSGTTNPTLRFVILGLAAVIILMCGIMIFKSIKPNVE